MAFGLDVAILVGVALSILLYVSRAASLKCVELLVDRDGKRVRHPDVVCLERVEHFLRACSRRNVTVLLARRRHSNRTPQRRVTRDRSFTCFEAHYLL